MSSGGPVPVYLEVGAKRVFACSLEWPGWCRSGPTEEAALATLADYTGRYAAVPEVAGRAFAAGPPTFAVLERVPGNATTDFGAPGIVPAADAEPLDRAGAERLAALVEAAWAVLDAVVAASPASLRKGPRGGGRDRDAMAAHVVAAEASYARKLGVRHRAPEPGDRAARDALRSDVAAALRRAHEADPAAPTAWPARYAARRVAWHVLDHAWEMQDRSEPAGPDGA